MSPMEATAFLLGFIAMVQSSLHLPLEERRKVIAAYMDTMTYEQKLFICKMLSPAMAKAFMERPESFDMQPGGVVASTKAGS